VFTQGRELPLLGPLLALPALAETGLFAAAETVYGKLCNGFYGLRSVLLMLVCVALLRELRAEGATRIVPQDLGRVLALDWAPEVKTLRRRLREQADRGWAVRSSKRWLSIMPKRAAWRWASSTSTATSGCTSAGAGCPRSTSPGCGRPGRVPS